MLTVHSETTHPSITQNCIPFMNATAGLPTRSNNYIDFANSKYVHIPQPVTIQFSLASTLTCVLIQNGPMTLNLVHQKTLTFNTQTPSSLCATKEVEKYWLLSVAVQVLIILDVVLWVCVCHAYLYRILVTAPHSNVH